MVEWLKTLYVENQVFLDHVNRIGQFVVLAFMVVSTSWICGTWLWRRWLRFASNFSDVAALNRAKSFAKAQEAIITWRTKPVIMHAVIGKAVTYALLNFAALAAVGLTFPDSMWRIIIVWYFFLCICYNVSPCIPVFEMILDPAKRCDRLIKVLERHIARSEGKRSQQAIDSMRGVLESVDGFKKRAQQYLSGEPSIEGSEEREPTDKPTP